MSDQAAQLTQRLLTLFKGEARERITAIAAALQALDGEATPGRDAVIENAFREAHSLKAAAGVVGQNDISQICHTMESAFAALKRGDIGLARNLLDALHASSDALDDFLGKVDEAPTPDQHILAGDLVEALAVAMKSAAGAIEPVV